MNFPVNFAKFLKALLKEHLRPTASALWYKKECNGAIAKYSYTTFTLDATITDSKLIHICFQTSSNIYPFPTVYTRLWKRNNDCFQFSRLYLFMIMTGARWSMICSRILRFHLFILQNYISYWKLKAVKNHYGNFYVFIFIRFSSKSVLISKI